MKTFRKIALAVAILTIIVLVIYLLRDTKFFGNLWVAISSIYAAALLLFSKFKNFFTGESKSLEELKSELENVNKVEKEFIDLLLKEREVYKEKLSRLELEAKEIDSKIESKEELLAKVDDLNYWEKEIWGKMDKYEKDKLTSATFGKELSLEEYAYNDM